MQRQQHLAIVILSPGRSKPLLRPSYLHHDDDVVDFSQTSYLSRLRSIQLNTPFEVRINTAKMLAVRSALGMLRDHVADQVEHADFFATGQIGTKDFEAAGDYLATRFPSWQWYKPTELTNPIKKLDPNKQFLKCLGVPCRQRLNDTFQEISEQQDTTVVDGEDFRSGANSGTPGDDEDGWVKTADLAASQERRGRGVKTLDESGNVPDESDDIPDMDEDDPDALPQEKTSKEER